MRNCQNCKSELPEAARFCPDCGAEQPWLVQACTNCEKLNEEDALFCIHCGEAMQEIEILSYSDELPVIYKAKYPLHFWEAVRLPVQFRTYFLKTLREQLEEEGKSSYFDDYVDRFYDSSFLKSFDQEAAEMAEHCYMLSADRSPNAARQVDEYLSEKFKLLIKRFLLREARTINENKVDEEVLPYEANAVANQHIGDMVLDYLNMDEEQEKWYTDIQNMPKLKLKNALDFFLFTDPSEKIFIICDQTIFGSCREGFALTNKALYWKAHFNKPQQLNYKEIESISLSEEWLVINERYFNASPAINVKMMHLLKKLSGRNF